MPSFSWVLGRWTARDQSNNTRSGCMYTYIIHRVYKPSEERDMCVTTWFNDMHSITSFGLLLLKNKTVKTEILILVFKLINGTFRMVIFFWGHPLPFKPAAMDIIRHWFDWDVSTLYNFCRSLIHYYGCIRLSIGEISKNVESGIRY